MIESLSLKVEKLEGATIGSTNSEKVSSMGVDMIVDESQSMGDRNIIGKYPSNDIGEKTRIKRARI